MDYRKEIDGLRAIAILPVIWLHSGLPYIPGGFLGVDVFFVISGFLITSILIKEFTTNTFSLIKFYERRARRILPALFIVIVITSFFVLLLSDHPKFIGDYGTSVLSTTFFVSNIYFWRTSGYFGSASELSPMLHTWSLAVEEQYYIFFPLLLMFLFPLGRKAVINTIFIILICSLFISEWGAVNSPDGNFYLLPSRAWELMAGALAAIFYSNAVLIKLRNHFSNILSGIGILLILSAYYIFTPSTLHPTSLTVWPVLGVVLVLLFSTQETIVGKALSIKPLNIVGLMSYSLYLWHQPILALMKKMYSIHLAPSQTAAAIILIFFCSYLSWRFVENPFRNKHKYKSNKIFKLSLISILTLSFFGVLFKNNAALQKIVYPEKMSRFAQLLEAEESHSDQIMFESNCKFWSKEFNDSFTTRFEACAKQHQKAIFILGGSHGMDLYNSIAMNSSNPFIVSVSRGFCRAHTLSQKLKTPPHCQYKDFKVFAEKYSNNISYVLYTQTPDRLFEANSLHNATVNDLSESKVEEVVNYLNELKTVYELNVLMIGMLPPLLESPINWSFNQPLEEQFNKIISKNSIYLTKYVDDIFHTKLQQYAIPYISKFDSFQLNLPTDLIKEGHITYSDNRHISYYGESYFGKKLITYLVNNGFKSFDAN